MLSPAPIIIQYQTAWNIAAHSAPAQQWWETQKLQVHTGLQGCTHSWHLCRQLSREMLFSHHLLLNIVPMLWCLRASWELKIHCPEWKARSEWKREKQNFPKFRFQLNQKQLLHFMCLLQGETLEVQTVVHTI
jgi:hypothetical protein